MKDMRGTGRGGGGEVFSLLPTQLTARWYRAASHPKLLLMIDVYDDRLVGGVVKRIAG